MLRHGLIASALVVGLGIIQQAKAQNSVYMPAILELSGTGAVSGTNFRDGIDWPPLSGPGGMLV